MADEIKAHMHPTHQTVPEQTPDKCPTCGAGPSEFYGGFGLAGGGYGVYQFCTKCGTILSKKQVYE